jgi:hypothetical protein
MTLTITTTQGTNRYSGILSNLQQGITYLASVFTT